MSLDNLGLIFNVNPISSLLNESLAVPPLFTVVAVFTDWVLPTYISDSLLFKHKIDGSLKTSAADSPSNNDIAAPKASPSLRLSSSLNFEANNGSAAITEPPKLAVIVVKIFEPTLPPDNPYLTPTSFALSFDISIILAFTYTCGFSISSCFIIFFIFFISSRLARITIAFSSSSFINCGLYIVDLSLLAKNLSNTFIKSAAFEFLRETNSITTDVLSSFLSAFFISSITLTILSFCPTTVIVFVFVFANICILFCNIFGSNNILDILIISPIIILALIWCNSTTTTVCLVFDTRSLIIFFILLILSG